MNAKIDFFVLRGTQSCDWPNTKLSAADTSSLPKVKQKCFKYAAFQKTSGTFSHNHAVTLLIRSSVAIEMIQQNDLRQIMFWQNHLDFVGGKW